MAIARVGASQMTTNSNSSVTLTRTFGTINNLVVVGFLGTRDVTVSLSISDTQGNSWTIGNAFFNDATNGTAMQSWHCLAKNTLSTTITISRATGLAFNTATLDEFSGNATTTPLDQNNHSVIGASGTPTGGAITLGTNDCLVWALCSDNVSAVGNIDGSSATKGADDLGGDWSEFRVLTGRSGVSVNVAFTGSGAYDVLNASFKPAAAVGDTQEWRGCYPVPFRQVGNISY